MKIKVTHVKPEFVDERGGIARILEQEDFPLRTVLRIVSKKGSVRSNHYHKTDSHYLYIESGKCEYSEKKAHDPHARIETVTLKPGDLVLSKPGIIHAVKFLEDSVLFAFTSETREQEHYEKDTERIIIVE